MPTIAMLTQLFLFSTLTAGFYPAFAQSDSTLASASALATFPTKLHCPASREISAYAIPHSLHTFYSAEVFGIKFSGFDLSGLPLADMPLSQSFVAENGDKWSLHCIYANDGLNISLMTEAYAELINCRFPDGSYQCLGEVERCSLSCRSDQDERKVGLSDEIF